MRKSVQAVGIEHSCSERVTVTEENRNGTHRRRDRRQQINAAMLHRERSAGSKYGIRSPSALPCSTAPRGGTTATMRGSYVRICDISIMSMGIGNLTSWKVGLHAHNAAGQRRTLHGIRRRCLLRRSCLHWTLQHCCSSCLFSAAAARRSRPLQTRAARGRRWVKLRCLMPG